MLRDSFHIMCLYKSKLCNVYSERFPFSRENGRKKKKKSQKKDVAPHLQSNMCEALAAMETGGKLLAPSAESRETRAQRLQQLL